jgi:serine phosphatase RsbU (regulator of sigma subunit)
MKTTRLRHKIGLLLLAVSGTALLLAAVVGHRALRDLATDMSRELARAEAQLTREKIQALVGRELAMAQRFAGLSALGDWLINEQNTTARTRFLAEAMGFRQAFADRTYFVIHHRTLAYYYADPKSPGARFRYTLDRSKNDDAWYFTTMEHPTDYTLNVNPDATLKETKLWINVQVRNMAGMPLGLVGTGMQLDGFLRTMLTPRSPGAMSCVVDSQGRIVAHPDPERIEYAAMAKPDATKTIFAELASDEDRQAMEQALASISESEQPIAVLETQTIHGRRMTALTGLPELGWTVISMVNPDTTSVLSSGFVRLSLAGGGVTLLLLILAVTIGFNRIVLRPLDILTESARQMAKGRYHIRLHSDRSDEIGVLSTAFDSMAEQVQTHTAELERRVAERTRQLAATNDELTTTHRRLTESIRYASLIQQVILPTRQLNSRLQGRYFVLWQPRDVVGGDFYLYRENDHGCLFGVVDCAGHGVPGAFMTMIAHAALERATLELDWHDPALLLERVDQAVRGMLPDTDRLERLATSMDIGLCFVSRHRRAVFFSGARIDLFVAGKDEVQHYQGERCGINDRKRRQFRTQTLLPDPDRVFYLVTDGILDQSGGERGLPFGRGGFTAWLHEHADQPLDVQEKALFRTLNDYRGGLAQRDDITVLAFRFETLSPASDQENQT